MLRTVLTAMVVASCAVFGLALKGVAQTDAESTAIPSQDGWWNRLQGPQEGEPSTPLRSVLSPVPLGPTTVPADGLGVGASGGDPDKVAAVGLVLDAPVDAFVDRLVLRLQETTQNGSNLSASSAKIAACPITTPWGGAANAEWQSRPGCDDSQKVDGERRDDGTWEFDLSVMAQGWVDGSLTQNGVLLAEAVDAPQSFQVSLKNIASGGVTTEFTATGGGFGGSDYFEFEPAPVDEFSYDVEPARETSTDFAPLPSTTRRSTTAAPTAAAPERPVTVRRPPLASAPGGADIWGGIAAAGVWVPVVLLLGLGLAYILGPAGRPQLGIRRTGGVSRALAARRSDT